MPSRQGALRPSSMTRFIFCVNWTLQRVRVAGAGRVGGLPSQSGWIWLLTPLLSPTSLCFGGVGREAYPFFFFFFPFLLLFLSSGMDSEVCNSCTGEVSAPNPKPEAVWVPVPELFWRRRREGWMFLVGVVEGSRAPPSSVLRPFLCSYAVFDSHL